MIRTVKLSLKHASPGKRRALAAVLERYRPLVNQYIEQVWERGGSLNQATLSSCLSERLSNRYHSRALHQALAICSSTRASAKALKVKASKPEFKRGTAQLSNNVLQIQPAKPGGAFDYMLKLSTLQKGRPIYLPVKATKMLNKWLSQPGATLKTACGISEDYVYFYVDIPELAHRTKGKLLGIDVGLNKMFVTSDGVRYGERFKELTQKIRRKRPGSKAMKRAQEERRQYINQTVNQLDWDGLQGLAVERLKDLKRGRRKNRNKSFRKALAPWTYAYVLERIQMKAAENRVRVVETSPAYTSQTCPKCGHVARSNRANEEFKCCRCGRADDADIVGAQNILARCVGEFSVPRLA
jgi:putative transposase